MARGTYVLLVPTNVTTAGISKVVRELASHGVKVLARGEGLLFVPYDARAKKAIAAGLSIQSANPAQVDQKTIRSLPEPAARVATIWNWKFAQQGRPTSEASVMSLLKQLKLTIRRDEVYDLVTKKTLGKVTREIRTEKKGNWTLLQTRYRDAVVGWFGYWRKYACKSQTYTSSALTNRLTVDYILAEVDGPSHYAYQSRSNASIAYASDWDYLWVWESDWADFYSYARLGASSASITRRWTHRS